MPTVSVVIPCYNGAKYLRETLESALAQTHPVLEVIVVDDGSTDDSAAIAESVGPPVRVIRQPNQGESTARNRGIDEARGDWIAFLDADDLWDPTKIAKQLAGVTPEVGATCTGYYAFQDPGKQIIYEYVPRAEDLTFDGAMTKAMNPCTASDLMIRRNLDARFPVSTSYGEDAIFILSLMRRTRFAVVPELLMGYRRHASAQSRTRYVRIKWYESIVGWLRQQSDLAPSVRERYERSLLKLPVAGCVDAYLARDWEAVDEYHRYLEPFVQSGAITTPLPRRRYPDWVYRSIDWVKHLGRRSPRLRRLVRRLKSTGREGG
jgi:glycosyltransferase involved in cell wall biosynthesis